MRNVKILKHFERPKEEGTHFRLVCLTGERKGDAYFLIGDRVVLGRSENADIKVHDIKSSREHAEIVKVASEYIITDLGSQNGIIVNDLKIKQRALKNGDKIIIGKTVYKFNLVVVKPKNKIQELSPSEKDFEFKDEEFESEKPKNNLSLLLVVLIVGGIYLIFMDGKTNTSSNQKNDPNYKVDEISDPFTASLKKRREEDNDSKKKMNIYFQKGLRELREENYFRAMNEFNHALSWTPNDPLAEFYLRKAKASLDKKIEGYFLKAKRNEESLKFQNAIVQYCAIIRLLTNYPDDERFKDAQNGVKVMEEKIGLNEGEIKCAQEIK